MNKSNTQSNIKSAHQSQLLEGFIIEKKRLNLLDKTIKEYIQHIDKFITWLIESDYARLDKSSIDNMLISVTKKISKEYMFYLREQSDKGGLGLKLNTAKKIRASAQQVYNYIVEEEELLGNAFNGVHIPKDEITEIKEYMCQEEGDMIYKACESTNHRVIIGLQLYMGMRIQEVGNIEVSNIDIENRTITFLRKNRRMRTLDIRDEIYDDICNAVEICEALGRKYLLQSPRGCKPLTTNAMRNVFDYYLDKLNLNKSFTPHNLRKLLATDLYYRKGFLLHEVSQVLDHSSLKTTEIYLLETKRNDVVNKFREI